MSRLRVAVLQGGPSAEASVSRASASSVADALREAGHDPVRIEIDGFVAETLRTGGFDVVFPVAHGAVGEDGCVQGLIEVLDLPYVGSDVLGSALAASKHQARKLFEADGIPMARACVLRRGPSDALAKVALETIGSRLVIKPAKCGSAIGVTRIDAPASVDAVRAALDKVWSLDDVAVVEHFAKGREVTCGVLDLDGEAKALPPTEILAPNDAFYTYEARYAPGRSRHLCPAPLGEDLALRVGELAVRAHKALGCRDLSRADFIVGDVDFPKAVFLLEVNTMPGFTATSLYPEAAAVAGLGFPTLCDKLVQQAKARGTAVRNRALPLP